MSQTPDFDGTELPSDHASLTDGSADLSQTFNIDAASNTLDDAEAADTHAATVPQAAPEPLPMHNTLRKIPVTLTLEVGTAKLTLGELAALTAGTVVPLDRAAGTPLALHVNGMPVGLAEVVVAGTQYGLKILTLDPLDLDRLMP